MSICVELFHLYLTLAAAEAAEEEARLLRILSGLSSGLAMDSWCFKFLFGHPEQSQYLGLSSHRE